MNGTCNDAELIAGVVMTAVTRVGSAGYGLFRHARQKTHAKHGMQGPVQRIANTSYRYIQIGHVRVAPNGPVGP